MNNTKSFKKTLNSIVHIITVDIPIYCFEKKDSKIFRHEQDSNL